MATKSRMHRQAAAQRPETASGRIIIVGQLAYTVF